jgi:hypothetical protein
VEILSFQDAPSPKRKKSIRILLGIAVMAGVGVFGTTLAANITLGTDNQFQFGQGVVQTTRCDDAITVTPTSAFANTALVTSGSGSGGSFNFAGINLTNIDAACNGKTFTLKTYGDTGDALDIITGVSTITFIWHDPSFGPDPAGIGMDDTGTDDALVTFDTPVLPATDVFKVTLETS